MGREAQNGPSQEGLRLGQTLEGEKALPEGTGRGLGDLLRHEVMPSDQGQENGARGLHDLVKKCVRACV